MLPLASRRARPQGREDWRQITYDDGRRLVIDIDQANASALSSAHHLYDAWGRESNFTTFYDDGGRREVDLDETGGNSWSSWHNLFDPQGRLASSNEFYDDGRRFEIQFDTSGGNSWSSLHTMYDASGRPDYATRFFDDGNRMDLNYDGNGPGITTLKCYRADGSVCADGILAPNGTLTGVGFWNPEFGAGLNITNFGGMAGVLGPAPAWQGWTPPGGSGMFLTNPSSPPPPDTNNICGIIETPWGTFVDCN